MTKLKITVLIPAAKGTATITETTAIQQFGIQAARLVFRINPAVAAGGKLDNLNGQLDHAAQHIEDHLPSQTRLEEIEIEED
jgi:hypothetical protein